MSFTNQLVEWQQRQSEREMDGRKKEGIGMGGIGQKG